MCKPQKLNRYAPIAHNVRLIFTETPFIPNTRNINLKDWTFFKAFEEMKLSQEKTSLDLTRLTKLHKALRFEG